MSKTSTRLESSLASRRVLAALAATVAVSMGAAAQRAEPPRFEFFPGGTYDNKVPTPESILGYPVGAYHTNYAGLERWLGAVRANERVRVVKYGESVERRPLYLV